MKFLFYSEFGEIADLAMTLVDEGHEVLFHVASKDYEKIADGILTHIEDWYRYMGKGYVWVFDSCSFGDFQDWLREKGEAVFGGCAEGDRLENDRQAGQDWFADAGFDMVESHNFTDFAEAGEFITANTDRRWILKQNGSAPKSLSHMGKFDDGSDMIYHLDELKKRWNEAQFGPVDFDLMEVVEGLEVAASALFNGSDWMRDEDGKVVGFLNFEEKKEADGGTGETTGEMGTTFYGCNEDNELFREIICRPAIKARLRKIGFHGVFDINCIVTDEGKIVALEPTCRLGVPSTAYEFCEAMEGVGRVMEAVAKGQKRPVALWRNWGMVVVVVAKPFPLEADVEDEATSIGERLWILKDGKPVDELDSVQKKHIHLYNFKRDDEGYKVATKSGYLLTVTATGEDIASIREGLIEYIKDNLLIAGQKYRSDVGKRVEEYESSTELHGDGKADGA
jgi:phosphoribosylamine-glycine ligase